MGNKLLLQLLETTLRQPQVMSVPIMPANPDSRSISAFSAEVTNEGSGRASCETQISGVQRYSSEDLQPKEALMLFWIPHCLFRSKCRGIAHPRNFLRYADVQM